MSNMNRLSHYSNVYLKMINCKFIAFTLLLASLIIAPTALQAEDSLNIRLEKPDAATQIIRGEYWTLYLDGVIDKDAAKRLSVELKRNTVKYGVAKLNSSGGNLFAGIEIGRLLREHGLSTSVLKKSKGEDVSGYCYSACVYAFVGGYFRTLGKDDALGVHRFSNSSTSATDLDSAQIAAGYITEYLNEMGINIRLFELTTRISSNQIYILSVDEALNLKVANNGYQTATWSIESTDKGLYLKGIQDAWGGLGKMTFTCVGNKILAFAFYTTGSNASLIAQNADMQFVRLDDDFIDIKSFDKSKPNLLNEDGVLSRFFIMPLSFAERIKAAKSVGYAVQTGNKDLFYGFKVDMVADRKKISNYFTQCLSEN